MNKMNMNWKCRRTLKGQYEKGSFFIIQINSFSISTDFKE